ncbi:MAG TPA: sucrase ferredoxin [Candidatus Baltobacteraceae bacterium]|nr:sucrase ferredoxin [Candidatus Baltobacteraceae bacterium]
MIFCAAQAEERGDTMLGTAPPQSRVLLVHQPGPWGPRGLTESRCNPAVAQRIEAAAGRAGMRVQAIRRPGKHERDRPTDVYDVAIADASTITWWRTDDLAAFADELDAGVPRAEPLSVETAPLFLVCTHGRHDACCALRGIPLATALHGLRPGRVWETTHLSGDRFAANVLVLPGGDLYGRVVPELAAALVDAAEARNVIPALLRGRLGMAPFAQAALVYAHEQLGIAARDALTVEGVEPNGPDGARVTLAAPDGRVVVTVAASTSAPARLTCRGPVRARARVYTGVAISGPGERRAG